MFFFDDDLDEYMENITLTLTLRFWTNERSRSGAEYLRDNPNPGIATLRRRVSCIPTKLQYTKKTPKKHLP